MALNIKGPPKLFKDKDGKELPVEPVTPGGKDRTAYLDIDLEIMDKRGRPTVPMPPMTAVFAPDPSQLSGNVDVILWLHGDKGYWTKERPKDISDFSGQTIKYYLTQLPLCRLREFILPTTKKKFILVAPTMSDTTGHVGKDPRPGLRWEPADAEAYLQLVVDAVHDFMGAPVTGVGNIVLAAHSGGGHLQGLMAQYFSGKFDKANEVWCFDSTFWAGQPFIAWVNKGHANARLWVYSSANKSEGTGYSAAAIMDLKPNIMNYATVSPPKPQNGRYPLAKAAALINNGIGWLGAALGTAAHAAAIATTQIDVLIEKNPNTGKPASTDTFSATYGGMAGGHYEGMQQYLGTLVQTSQNLK
jgi:hypothetical protein